MKTSDDIDEAYRHAIKALREMRRGYRTIAVLPDEECSPSQRVQKYIVIEHHREFLSKVQAAIEVAFEDIRPYLGGG